MIELVGQATRRRRPTPTKVAASCGRRVGENRPCDDDPAAAPFTWGCYPIRAVGRACASWSFWFDGRQNHLPIMSTARHPWHRVRLSRWRCLMSR